MNGTQVRLEALGGEKILVEKGLAVDSVHHDAPNPPPGPNPPRKSWLVTLTSD
jgi:hypothetical protein